MSADEVTQAVKAALGEVVERMGQEQHASGRTWRHS